MLSTKQFLKQGLKIGPWKVNRKVLLVVLAVGIAILTLGAFMLETHAFDGEDSDDDDDGSSEKYDDDEKHWRGGDMVLMLVMGIAGIFVLLSVLICFFAEVNPPSHLEHRGNEQIFTIQLTKPSIGPQHSYALNHYQHYQQQHQEYEQQLQAQRQHEQQQQQSQSQREQQSRGSSQTRRQPQASAASEVFHARSPPPPYAPPTEGSAPATNSRLASEQPPPYSP